MNNITSKCHSCCLYVHLISQQRRWVIGSRPFLSSVPIYETLQTSQLLSNLLMVDWNYMLEPQQLQSTTTVVRPNTLIEKTWASNTTTKNIGNYEPQGQTTLLLVWGEVSCFENGITRCSHPSAGPIRPLRLNVRALPFFFSCCRFDSLQPSIFQYCMQTIRSLLMYLCTVIDIAL